MTVVNKIKIKEEILNFLRNQDLIDIATRNVTTETDNFTSTEGQTDFTLTATNIVRNIRSVKVNSVAKTAYLDYDIGIINEISKTKIVSFYSGLSSGDSVTIIYDESTGDGDRFYPDMDEEKIIKSTFPRINFEIEETTTEPINNNHTKYNKMVVITFHILASRWEIETLSKSLYESIFNNRFSWQNNNLMRPSGESNNIPVEKRKDVLRQFLYFRCPFEFEQ